MAEPKRNERLEDKEHAYWRLDHKEWLEDVQAWHTDIENMEKALSEMQSRLQSHKERVRDHQQGIRGHEAGIDELEASEAKHKNISYLKSIDERRDEDAAKMYFGRKTEHENLKNRHYIISGQLQLLKQALAGEGT